MELTNLAIGPWKALKKKKTLVWLIVTKTGLTCSPLQDSRQSLKAPNWKVNQAVWWKGIILSEFRGSYLNLTQISTTRSNYPGQAGNAKVPSLFASAISCSKKVWGQSLMIILSIHIPKGLIKRRMAYIQETRRQKKKRFYFCFITKQQNTATHMTCLTFRNAFMCNNGVTVVAVSNRHLTLTSHLSRWGVFNMHLTKP